MLASRIGGVLDAVSYLLSMILQAPKGNAPLCWRGLLTCYGNNGSPRSSEVSDPLEALLSSVAAVWFILAALLEDK